MARVITEARAVITGRQWLVTLGIVIGVLFAAATALRVWQQLFAWTAGLDATSPEFATYWMIATLWIYTTVGTFSGCMQLAFFGEQDATWHQVAIRDTALTPSHIPLFYFWFPLLLITTVATFLYGRTRLPHIYRERGYPLSMLLMIGGIAGLFFWVAVNEFFHSFWQTEEIFSHPLHWGFVIFFYVGGAVIFSIWFQTLPRIYALIDQLQAESGSDDVQGGTP